MDEGVFFWTIIFFNRRKCEWNFGQIPSSIRNIMSLTNDPLFLFQMIQWRAAVITAKPFFSTPRKFAISHVFLNI